MILRFASASAVAAVAVALASVIFGMIPTPDLGGRDLITSIWCVVPFVWGLWAMITPGNWLPRRLPLWGSILGAIAGAVVWFVLELPERFAGVPLPAWVQGVGLALIVAVYYGLWLVVRRAYGALGGSS